MDNSIDFERELSTNQTYQNESNGGFSKGYNTISN